MEKFHVNEEKSILVYDTEGLFQIVGGGEEAIVIDDFNNPDILYIVSMRYGNIISFEIDKIDLQNRVSNCQWGISILLDERDVLLLDLDAEIIVTRNFDVYRLPFRYLLLSHSEDDFCRDLEYLGNCKPITAAQEQIVIREKPYDLSEL